KSGLGSVSVPQMSKDLQSRLMNSMVNGAVNNASKNFNEDHVKDLAKTIKALESAGLTNVMKALKLPSSDEVGRIEEMKAANVAKLQEDVKKLEQERREYALNSGHGAHTQDVALDYIQKRDKSKKMYKTAIRDIIIGADGVDYLPNEDIPAPLYFLDPSMMGLSDPVYLDALVPAKKERGVIVVLTDSSGSMGLSEIGQSIAESYRLVEEQEDETGASKVYFWSADTALRGKPVLMTRQNAAELCADMPIFGRGGTDVTMPLAQVMDWSKTNRVKIDGIIYITDMDVPPPQRSQLPELLPPLVFIGVGHNPDFLNSQLKTWVPACRDFAKVTCVDIREEIDFSALADDLDCGKYYESTDGYDNTTIEDEFIQVSRPKP
ncbi:TPA: hypothetical protein RQN23_003747, partial [Aeromonas veronii]|nr:hypothetical protein [Aeromonas veronii]